MIIVILIIIIIIIVIIIIIIRTEIFVGCQSCLGSDHFTLGMMWTTKHVKVPSSSAIADDSD